MTSPLLNIGRDNVRNSDALLTLILMGFEDPHELAEVSGLSEDVIRSLLSELVEKGFVSEAKKGLLLKKIYYKLTSKGYNQALKLYARLKEDAETIKSLLNQGFRDELVLIASRYSDSMWVFRALNLLEDDIIRRVLAEIRGQQGEFSTF